MAFSPLMVVSFSLFALCVAALDEIEDAAQIEQPGPSNLTWLPNTSAVNLTERIEFIEFRPAESGKVFRSRFRGANPHGKHSVPVA